MSFKRIITALLCLAEGSSTLSYLIALGGHPPTFLQSVAVGVVTGIAYAIIEEEFL